MKQCTQCGKQFDDGNKFCTFCGGSLEDVSKSLFCVNCGKKMNAGSKFCDFCGAKVENVYSTQKQISNFKLSKNNLFSLLQPKLLAVVAVLLIVFVGGAGYLLFGGRPEGPKVETIKLPTDISKIDKTKTTPVFNPSFERVVNYKRKVIAWPVFVKTNKTHVRVFDKPEGKPAGDLSQGTLCEVGDYKDTKSGTWLYLRLIQVLNGKKDTPKSGWIREADAEIDLKNSVVFKFTEEGINKPVGNYRLLYKVLGNTDILQYHGVDLLSYRCNNAVYLDLDSITKNNKYIFFTCLKVPDKQDVEKTRIFLPEDYRANFRYDTETHIIRQVFPNELANPEEEKLKAKWVKDENGIYYSTILGDGYISAPGNLIINGFLRVLEGR